VHSQCLLSRAKTLKSNLPALTRAFPGASFSSFPLLLLCLFRHSLYHRQATFGTQPQMHFNVKFLNKYLPNLQPSGVSFLGFFIFFFFFCGPGSSCESWHSNNAQAGGQESSQPVSQPARQPASHKMSNGAPCGMQQFFAVCVYILVHAPFIFAAGWPTNGTRIYLQLLRHVLLAASRQLYK